MRKIIGLFVIACGVLYGVPRLAAAQITGGAISGIVRNELGEVVAGAKVTCVNTGTNQSRSTVTDEDGLYRLPALVVGAYEITVEADKYQQTVKQVTLRVNEELKVEVELLAAGSSERVNVVGASSPITETSTSVLGIVIDNRQITQLPINGRNFLQLGSLVANVNTTASFRSGAEGGARNGPFAVAGQRDRSLSFLVDGVDNTNSLSDNLSARVSIDSIQEFKMITNLGSAEYGYHSGGMINIITKSGTNEFHYSLFDFFRNNKLNAANFFETVAGQPASHFVNNQFGGTIGGPVIKDKTFFLANYEGQRLRAGSPQFANVPTADQRRGIFRNPATGANVQLAVDPVAAEVLRRYVPLPNIQSEFGNFFSTPNLTGDNDFALVKLDHLLSGDDLINVRYYIYNSEIFYAINPEGVRQSAGRPASIPGFALIEPTRTQNLAISHTRNFSVRTINDLRFGYTRYSLDQVPETQIRPATVGFTGVEQEKGAIIFPVSGISTLGAIAYPILSRFGNYHISDSLSFMRGRHALKAGGEVRFIRQSLSHFEPGHTTIAFSGAVSRISPLADFILGVPAAVNIITRSQAAPMHQDIAGFFIQDDYQVNRRLVLNLGLRYELSTVLSSPTHKLTNFSLERGLFTPGVNTDTELYKGDHNDFAPRVGFALSLTDDSRTVLRGGYGIYYDAIVHTLASTLNRQNESGAFNFNSRAPRVPGRLGGMLEPSQLFGAPINPVAYDENLRTPYAQHFNLTLQREVGNSMVMSLGYVGSKGTKLVTLRDINQAIYIPGTDSLGRPLSTADPANIISRRPSQLFHLTPGTVGAVEQLETAVSSIYHSFQATLNKRMTRGLSVLGAYTWSKSIDDSSDPYGFTGDSGFPQDSNNAKRDRALSVFDSRHQFTVGSTYELPIQGNRWLDGWQLHTIATFKSGQPFTAILGFDPSLTGRSFVRPNNAPGAFINKDGQVFLNTDLPLDPVRRIPAAIIPKTGEIGNLGRNTFTGPNYKNVDFSVVKQTRIGEKLSLQSRFEIFNIFNTTNLALPERRLTDPFFGRSARTQDVAGGVPGVGGGGPRVIQLAVKIVY